MASTRALRSYPSQLNMDHALAASILILAAGIVLRLWGLADKALWLDEAYSKWYSALDIRSIWSIVPQADSHPPLYYTLLHAWRLVAGDTVFALRLPSALAGCLSLFFVWKAGMELARVMRIGASGMHWLAALSTAYVAFSPIAIAMARQARSYGLQQLCFAIAVWALLRLYRAWREGETAGPVRGWLAYFIALQFVLWLHSLGALFAFCLSSALLLLCVKEGRTERIWQWFIGGHLLTLLFYLPCLWIILQEMAAWRESTWLSFAADDVPMTFAKVYGWGLLTAPLVAILLGSALWSGLRGRLTLPVALLLWLALGPFVLEVLLSATVTPVLLFRTLAPVTVGTGLLLAALAFTHGPRGWQNILLLPTLVFMAIISVGLLPRMVSEDWAAVADWVESRRAAGDELWVYPNDVALPLGYALEDRRAPSVLNPLPEAFPALNHAGMRPTGAPGVVALSNGEIVELGRRAKISSAPTIWLIQHAERHYDSDGRVAAALGRQRTLVASATFQKISIYGYAKPR